MLDLVVEEPLSNIKGRIEKTLIPVIFLFFLPLILLFSVLKARRIVKRLMDFILGGANIMLKHGTNAKATLYYES